MTSALRRYAWFLAYVGLAAVVAWALITGRGRFPLPLHLTRLRPGGAEPIVLVIALPLVRSWHANLSVAEWGCFRQASLQRFLFIGLSDLHDRLATSLWRRYCFRNMALLIATGFCSPLCAWTGDRNGPFVGRIALASCVAFGAAATADAWPTYLATDRPWYERVNQSKSSAGLAVDSSSSLRCEPFGIRSRAFTLFAAARVAHASCGLSYFRRSEGGEWIEKRTALR